MEDSVYRFRSVENLIGEYQELEKQQIYFAGFDELNDPLEGTRLYFWQGDKIVWVNLLKHYILCLEHVVLLSRLLNDNETISKKDIPIYKSMNSLPTEIYKERIQKIYNQFFNDKFVQDYINFIVKNPNKIYLEEMYVHLKILSGIALNSIFEIDIQSGLLANIEKVHHKVVQRNIDLDWDNIWEELDEKQYIQIMKVIHDTLKSWDSELLLKFKNSPKQQSIYIEFTQMYLDSVVQLTYPRAYVACFMDNCLDSSIWGTYGKNHTGVCLKFRTNTIKPKLILKGISGWSSSSGNIYDYREFDLKPIEYSTSFEELDFFRNLGCLPIPQLKEQWYTNDQGELSVCCEEIFLQEEEWRKQYWNICERAYLKKLPDWSHEREYRIILNNVLGFYDNPKDRLLEYKFEDLEAIIFGMKTLQKAKIEIIEIVKRKCEEFGINQFDFYEMEYSTIKKELYPRKLLSLNKNNLKVED
jgi:hypothetical protein